MHLGHDDVVAAPIVSEGSILLDPLELTLASAAVFGVASSVIAPGSALGLTRPCKSDYSGN